MVSAQVLDEFTAQSGQLTSVGNAGFPYAAQSFRADVKIIRSISAWFAEASSQGQITLSLTTDLNGLPDLNAVLFESSLINPGGSGQWFVDSSMTVPVIPGQIYWLIADGFNNPGASGAAHVGTSTQFTDTGDDMVFALNASPVWDTLTGSRMAIRIEGDTCSFAGTVFQNISNFFCAGDSLHLQAAAGFSSYLWSTGDTTSDIWVNASGLYLITVLDANGCAAVDTAAVSQYSLPVFDLGPDLVDCDGAVFDLTGPNGPFLFDWSTGDTVFTIRVSDSGSYFLTVTNLNGCSYTDSLSISLLPRPVVDIGGDSLLCQGQVRVIDGGAGFSSYFWSDGQTTRSVVITTTGSVSLIVIDNSGCSGGSNTVNTQVVPNPAQPILTKDNDILSSSLGPAYQWLLNGNPIPAANGQTHIPQTGGSYSVMVIDSNGCFSESETLFVVTQVDVNEIYGGFSPNGDGVNDFFEIIGLEFFPGNVFSVYNRWGNIVYQSSTFDGFWDGNNSSSDPLPDGTYIYILELNNGGPPFQGTVVINR